MSGLKYYMETCSECGDDAEMPNEDWSCPQCGNVDVDIHLNPDYSEED